MNRNKKKLEPLFKLNGIFPVYYGGDTGFSVDQITENLAYVIDGAGWKLFKRNGVTTALIELGNVSGANAVKPYINFTAVKIPFSLLEKVIAFFKEVYRKYQSEAVGYLYFNPTTQEWEFEVPKQSASAAHASYEGAPQRPGWQVAGTIHSHGSMTAFHSGTDDADENFFDGVHITIGHCDQLNVEFSTSIVVNGQRKMLEIWDVVEDFPMPSAPTAWVNAVKLPAPRISLDWPQADQKEISALYDKYYAGSLSEADYLAKLKKIQKKAEDEAAKLRLRTSGIGGYGTTKKDKKNRLW